MTADEMVSVFMESWAGTSPPNLGASLNELYARARDAYPAFVDHHFIRALAAHAPADGVSTFLERVHAGELALTTAAAQGTDAAIAELERELAGVIGATCRRFEGKGHTADDLRQILRSKLYVGDDRAIRNYNGQGSLGSWLRVIATRLFIDLGRRKDRARESPEDPHDLDVAQTADLALDLVKAEYRAVVAAALAEAAHALEPGDRHLLRHHLVFGLSIDQVGAVLGIHRATAARRIAKARELFAERTRELVAARLDLDEGELAALFGLVVSKLDLSIRRVLASQAAESES